MEHSASPGTVMGLGVGQAACKRPRKEAVGMGARSCLMAMRTMLCPMETYCHLARKTGPAHKQEHLPMVPWPASQLACHACHTKPLTQDTKTIKKKYTGTGMWPVGCAAPMSDGTACSISIRTMVFQARAPYGCFTSRERPHLQRAGSEPPAGRSSPLSP